MNAMMWVRGFAADYDEWGTLAGDDGTSPHVAEYFERIEPVRWSISRQRSPRSLTGGMAHGGRAKRVPDRATE